MIHTAVFYEKTEDDARWRLKELRGDGFKEIKAYILREGKNKFRVLRKVKIPSIK